MLARLSLAGGLYRSAVSGYELGTREPPLSVLLKFAETAGVWVDVLIDDDLELPKKSPANQRNRRQSGLHVESKVSIS